MLTHRVLPPEEWSQVADREPFASGGLPDPRYWRIVVVERDGQIIAACSLFDTVHWDMFSVDEDERGNPVVFGSLIAGGVQVMIDYNIRQVHTTVPAGHPDLARMLERFGFTRAPGELYFFTRD